MIEGSFQAEPDPGLALRGQASDPGELPTRAVGTARYRGTGFLERVAMGGHYTHTMALAQ